MLREWDDVQSKRNVAEIIYGVKLEERESLLQQRPATVKVTKVQKQSHSPPK